MGNSDHNRRQKAARSITLTRLSPASLFEEQLMLRLDEEL